MGKERSSRHREAGQVCDFIAIRKEIPDAVLIRAAKKGLWSLKNFEHPADYKKRMKVVEEGMDGAEETVRRVKHSGSGRLWRSLVRFMRRRP